MSKEETTMIQSESRMSRIKQLKIVFTLINLTLLFVGDITALILMRLYFLHGGNRRWLSAFISTAGFPILLIPIIAVPIFSKQPTSDAGRASFLLLPPKLIASTAGVGTFLGLCSYLYSVGLSYLPISVFALISSTQLAFTSVAAYIVVKQRFTVYSINAVVLMILGSVIIGIHVHSEKPVGTTASKYVLGIIMTILASAVHGFLFPVLEYVRIKSGVVMSFGVQMQLQFFILMFATFFCTIPMLINGDFQAILEEAAVFGLGKKKYYTILLVATLGNQLMIIGILGLILTSSSLFTGIVSALLVPVQQIFAVMFLPETFSADKGISLVVCLWGFASYFYGDYKMSKSKANDKQDELEKESALHKEGLVV